MATRTTATTLSEVTESRFDGLANVNEVLKRAIRETFQYEFMTRVQQQSLPVCLTGEDVVAKARTGTGKTISFLLPALQRMLEAGVRRGKIATLILSPTRELAKQIETEAKGLTSFCGDRIRVGCIVGGQGVPKRELAQLAQNPPTLLVATPGRLQDHLENGAGIMGGLLDQLSVLIFDEADQLLDMGFRPTILRILGLLPPADRRQTLLFSATFPKSLEDIARLSMRPNYRFVDTVGDVEKQTVQLVKQHINIHTM